MRTARLTDFSWKVIRAVRHIQVLLAVSLLSLTTAGCRATTQQVPLPFQEIAVGSFARESCDQEPASALSSLHLERTSCCPTFESWPIRIDADEAGWKRLCLATDLVNRGLQDARGSGEEGAHRAVESVLDTIVRTDAPICC